MNWHMNEKAIIGRGEYCFVEVIPVLNGKIGMVLCTDTTGIKYACLEE